MSEEGSPEYGKMVLKIYGKLESYGDGHLYSAGDAAIKEVVYDSVLSGFRGKGPLGREDVANYLEHPKLREDLADDVYGLSLAAHDIGDRSRDEFFRKPIRN